MPTDATADPSADPVAHPIPAAWISTGGTGAQNYDEFASDEEITAIIEANPASILAVDMPHRAPESVAAGHDFAAALPAAAERLAALERDGRLRAAADVVAPYRIQTSSGPAYGVFCLVETAQISDRAGKPGSVIRNEEVFPAKVAERTALTRYLGVLLSPVLLLQTTTGDGLHAFLAELTGSLGDPAVADTDQHGQRHEIWTLGPGAERDRLLALAGSGSLIVADGNHRSLSAQEAGLDRFLAVITTPGSVTIAPYHRLLRSLPMPVDAMLKALTDRGATVVPMLGDPRIPEHAGTVTLYAEGQTYALTLPPSEGTVADRLDHAVLERELVTGILGLDPGDKLITYVGGDYPAEWLTREVDTGRAAAALLMAPVSVPDFIAVNVERLTMPRKSTWFTPKARTGLVLADLPSAPEGAGEEEVQ
ncbi:MAG: hypothetical protein QOJ50_649 [Cryptosporangiaceae bacterium]|nr:hypothetical protein [Cryptosporangiaceae bacterium]